MRASVIKPGVAGRLPAASSTLALRDMRDEALAALTAARAAAEQLIAEARVRAAAELEAAKAARERILDSARAEGFEAGRAEGRGAALEEARARFARESAETLVLLRTALDEVRARREQLVDQTASDALILAVAIARRVANGAAAIDPAVATESARKAVAALRARDAVAIRANPLDRDRLAALCPTLRESLAGGIELTIAADDAVPAGGVLVHAGEGVIDATLVAQVERIADELLDNWRQRLPAETGATGETL
jgi:flagellar assembly protein FliH